MFDNFLLKMTAVGMYDKEKHTEEQHCLTCPHCCNEIMVEPESDGIVECPDCGEDFEL